MLSQSHPTYVLQLRASIATTKSDTDKAIMMLSILSLGILFSQVLTGMFVFHFEVLFVERSIGVVSMNVTLPHNLREPGGKLNGFGVVIALVVTTTGIFVLTVRHWWLQAKRKRRAML